MQIMKTGRIVTSTTRQVKTSSILAEQYIRDHMSKLNDQYSYSDDKYRQHETKQNEHTELRTRA